MPQSELINKSTREITVKRLDIMQEDVLACQHIHIDIHIILGPPTVCTGGDISR